jgi:hypothetical protein
MLVTVTSYVLPDPESEEILHPALEPDMEKSSIASPVTDSEKTRSKTNVEAFDGLTTCAVNVVIVGAS